MAHGALTSTISSVPRIRRFSRLLTDSYFCEPPDFKAVHRWRLEQERKLAEKAGETNRGIMDETQLADFLQHFERLTRTSIDLLPGTADVILSLDENHLVTRSDYRRRT